MALYVFLLVIVFLLFWMGQNIYKIALRLRTQFPTPEELAYDKNQQLILDRFSREK